MSRETPPKNTEKVEISGNFDFITNGTLDQWVKKTREISALMQQDPENEDYKASYEAVAGMISELRSKIEEMDGLKELEPDKEIQFVDEGGVKIYQREWEKALEKFESAINTKAKKRKKSTIMTKEKPTPEILTQAELVLEDNIEKEEETGLDKLKAAAEALKMLSNEDINSESVEVILSGIKDIDGVNINKRNDFIQVTYTGRYGTFSATINLGDKNKSISVDAQIGEQQTARSSTPIEEEPKEKEIDKPEEGINEEVIPEAEDTIEESQPQKREVVDLITTPSYTPSEGELRKKLKELEDGSIKGDKLKDLESYIREKEELVAETAERMMEMNLAKTNRGVKAVMRDLKLIDKIREKLKTVSTVETEKKEEEINPNSTEDNTLKSSELERGEESEETALKEAVEALQALQKEEINEDSIQVILSKIKEIEGIKIKRKSNKIKVECSGRQGSFTANINLHNKSVEILPTTTKNETEEGNKEKQQETYRDILDKLAESRENVTEFLSKRDSLIFDMINSINKINNEDEQRKSIRGLINKINAIKSKIRNSDFANKKQILNVLNQDIKSISSGNAWYSEKREKVQKPEKPKPAKNENNQESNESIQNIGDALEYLQSVTTAGKEYETIGKLKESTQIWLKKNLGMIATPIEERIDTKAEENLIQLAKRVKSELENKTKEKEVKNKTQAPKTEEAKPTEPEKIKIKKPKVGDFVIWISEGQAQWGEYRRILKTEKHGDIVFAFFEGGEAGIPMDQLELYKGNTIGGNTENKDAVNETTEEPETPKQLSIEDLIEIDEQGDYSEILRDQTFENWLKTIYVSLKQKGINNEFERRHISDWHESYTKSKVLFEKLQSISKASKDSGEKKSILADTKISALVFALYRDFEGNKDMVEQICAKHEKNQQNKEYIDKLNKIKKVKGDINEARSKGSKLDRELKSSQIKELFEATKGDEEIGDTISGLYDFLKDMDENYSQYTKGIKTEDESGGVGNIIRRYTDDVEFNNAKGFGGKMFAYIGQKLPFIRSKKLEPEKINRFAPLIREVRKQNLVERIGKNDNVLNQENRNRMGNLLHLIRENSAKLIQYAKDPKKFDMTDISEEDKKLYEIFGSMYKTFSDSRYRDNTIRSEAEKMLKNDEVEQRFIDETSREVVKTEDILFEFETDEDLHKLEQKAEYEIGLRSLDNVEKEILDLKTKKRGKDSKVDSNKVKDLVNRFETATQNIRKYSEYGDENDELRIRKIELTLQELVIDGLNKNEESELNKIFRAYEVLLSSNALTKEKKLEHVNSLLKALNLHRSKSTNTILQNMVLDAKIREYTEIRSKLSK